MTIEEKRRLGLVSKLLEMTLPLERVIQELAEMAWDYEGDGIELTKSHLIFVLKMYLGSRASQSEVELWANQVEGRDDVRLDVSSESLIVEILHELANPLLTQPLNHIRATQLLIKLE